MDRNTTWVTDNTHTQISFQVRSLMISSLTGYFTDFAGIVRTHANDFSTSEITFSAVVNSLSTFISQRDTYLLSRDFFDAESFPALNFVSTSMRLTEEQDVYKLHGHLTIKGITRPIILMCKYGGLVTDLSGQTKAGFALAGIVSRRDFGIVWNQLTEAGGVIVGDEVLIRCHVQLIKNKNNTIYND